MQFVGVAHEVTLSEGDSVGEGDVSGRLHVRAGENLGNIIALVLKEFVGFDVERIADSERFEMTSRFPGGILYFYADTRHRGLAWREDNVFKIHVAVGASQVFSSKPMTLMRFTSRSR